jgi:hypothetical protein
MNLRVLRCENRWWIKVLQARVQRQEMVSAMLNFGHFSVIYLSDYFIG